MALKMQPLWIIHTPAHISIRFGASSIPFGFEISWRGCYLGAMWKKKEKLYNPSYAYGKKNRCVLINCMWRWNISLWKWPPFAVWFWFAGCGIKFHLTGFMFLPSFVHSLTKHLLSANCSQTRCYVLREATEGDCYGMDTAWSLCLRSSVFSGRWMKAVQETGMPKPMTDPQLIHLLIAWLLWLL